MLPKAAVGSAKNIVPNRLIANVERLIVKWVDLGVRDRVRDVVEALSVREFAGALDRRSGGVDAQDAADDGRVRGVTRGLTSPAPDVDHRSARPMS